MRPTVPIPAQQFRERRHAIQSTMSHLANILRDYGRAKEPRHRYIISVDDEADERYFAGTSGFVRDRSAAARFTPRPVCLATSIPGARIKLA